MKVDILASLLGEWSQSVNIYSSMLKIVLTVVMGTILGAERARNRHAAGLRTFIVVALGAMLAGVGDLYFVKVLSSFPFLSAATVIGIAIISGNTILFTSKSQIKGLTTSGGLWAMALIGITVGLGLYTTALIAFAVLLFALSAFNKMERYFKARSSHFEIHLELVARNVLQEFTGTIRKFGLKIDDIEINPAYANSGLGVYTIKLKVVDPNLCKKTHKEIIDILSSLECVHYIEEIQ